MENKTQPPAYIDTFQPANDRERVLFESLNILKAKYATLNNLYNCVVTILFRTNSYYELLRVNVIVSLVLCSLFYNNTHNPVWWMIASDALLFIGPVLISIATRDDLNSNICIENGIQTNEIKLGDDKQRKRLGLFILILCIVINIGTLVSLNVDRILTIFKDVYVLISVFVFLNVKHDRVNAKKWNEISKQYQINVNENKEGFVDNTLKCITTCNK